MSIINKEILKDEKINKNVRMLLGNLSEIYHNSNEHIDEKSIVILYSLYKIKESGNKLSLDKFVEENANSESSHILNSSFIKKNIDALTMLTNKFSKEDFAVAIFRVSDSFNDKNYTITPNSIIKLADCLMDIKANDNVADLCCGFGAAVTNFAINHSRSKFTGYDISINSNIVSNIKSKLVGENIRIEIKDIFELFLDDHKSFDKIFANYPLGLRVRNLGYGANYIDRISKICPEISKATSSDWIFNSLICDMLNETGKGIGIMTNGGTWNTIDKPMRKYFIENGLIECVISLPARLFNNTAIPTTMVIFSHNNNSVKLIDATTLYRNCRRYNEFSDENIETILDAYSNDSKYSVTLNLETLKKNDYVLHPSRYMDKEIVFENATPFENVIKSITRGAPCTAKQLDEMVSEDETDMQYLMLANIKDGLISEHLPYLSHIDTKYERYCLKNKNLILSKNGYPYKVAVANITNNKKILANGNLYIIELDEEKVDPYYLKAFFESEKGIAALKSISVGAAIPNIGIDMLKKLNIPVPPVEEQKKIALKYQAKIDEISLLKLKLERATTQLHNIFDEEGAK